MRTRFLVALPAVAAVVAGCGAAGGQHLSSAGAQGGGGLAAPASAATSQAPAASSGSGTPAACRTSHLSLRFGRLGAAAGSTYAPVVFTNTGSAACTLFGYPGVAYVAPSTGKQIGAAASRNPQHSARTVTLAPAGSASVLVQMADPLNFSASQCKSDPVSGLRVYPPGNTAAAYVAFKSTQTACSTNVNQLSTTAVIVGTTGQ